jgi:hypothetical protein
MTRNEFYKRSLARAIRMSNFVLAKADVRAKKIAAAIDSYNTSVDNERSRLEELDNKDLSAITDKA